MTKVFNEIVRYPLVWTPKSKREFTSKEKKSVKSCKVVQTEVLGHLGVEFCMHETYKGKHVRPTITIWSADEEKFKLNQKLDIENLALLTVVSNTGDKVLRVTLK